MRSIRADLVNNIAEIARTIGDRTAFIEDATIIIGHLEGMPITDVNDFNGRCLNIYSWESFTPISFTVEELIYSGNLALITSTKIKSTLLRLESAYKPLYAQVDLYPTLREAMGEKGVLTSN